MLVDYDAFGSKKWRCKHYARRSLAMVCLCNTTCSAYEATTSMLVQLCQMIPLPSWEAPPAL
eukprot:c52801_g1_i1 orf=88-273(+)